MARRFTVVLAVAAVAFLAGCTTASPAPTPSSPPMTATAAPTPTEAPTPLPEPTVDADADPGPPAVFPSCDELLTIDILHEKFSPLTVKLPAESDTDWVEEIPDPIARAAMEGALRLERCAWGLEGGSDGGIGAVMAELTPGARETLVSELREAEGFTEHSADGGLVFSREIESELSTRSVAYVFVGSTWITLHGSGSPELYGDVFAPAVIDAVHEANPA